VQPIKVGADGHDPRGHGELESEVLAALRAAARPLTAQTMLTRLLNKGLVSRATAGRAHTYQPTRGQAELTTTGCTP